MGFNFDEFDRLVSEGTSEAEQNPWDLVEDPVTGELVERGEQSDGRWWPPLGVENWIPAYEEDGLLRGIAGGEDWALDQLAEGRRRQGEVGAIEDLTVDEIDRLRDRAEAELGRRRNEGVGRTLPPEERTAEAAGLTADEAFQQHHAMSSGEQPRSDRAHPERPTPPTSREPWVPLSDEQNAINAEGIEEARKTLNGSRNPELRAMDSQMMTDLMAERAAQPEQGYFGGMGNAVQELTETVRAMSGEEQGMMIAALIAAGLLTAGSGGMLAPAGAALMGGAGMAALSQ